MHPRACVRAGVRHRGARARLICSEQLVLADILTLVLQLRTNTRTERRSTGGECWWTWNGPGPSRAGDPEDSVSGPEDLLASGGLSPRTV